MIDRKFTTEEAGRLGKAIAWSRKRMQTMRDLQREAVKAYVGYHYSDNAADDRVPISFIELAVTIYERLLSVDSPEVFVNTDHGELKPVAMDLELATNKCAKAIELEYELQRWIKNSLFSIGVMKLGMDWAPDHWPSVMMPFAETVDLDDLVLDMGAKSWRKLSYIGDRYRMPFDEFKDCGLYDTKGISPTRRSGRNDGDQDEGNDERLETIGQGLGSNHDELEDYVELWDVYIPSKQKTITLPYDGTARVLREAKKKSGRTRSTGPYELLAYSDVPGNILPAAPSGLWIDLHDLSNRLFLKLGRQAEREKYVTGYRGSAYRDAANLQKAGDGDMLEMLDPSNVHEFKTQGVSQQNLAFLLQLKELFSYFNGNLASLGGLGAQSDTVGQDRLMGEAASQRVKGMQQAVRCGVKRIYEVIGGFLFEDPFIDLPLFMPIPGTDVQVPKRFSSATIDGTYFDYNFDLAPYSREYKSPQQMYAQMQSLLQAILPLLPMMQQDSITLDWEGVIRDLSRYSGFHQFANNVRWGNGPQQPDRGPVGQAPPKAANTTRTYQRLSGRSTQGQEQGMIQQLLASGAQNGGGGGPVA